MSFYKKVFNEKNGVWYPQAVVMGQPVPVKQVAKRLSQMCTVTYADVMAVLGELAGVMADYMSQTNLTSRSSSAPCACSSCPNARAQ